MPWFKVDDGFAFHPKAMEAGNAALGLWVRAGSWCAANLTGGALPRHMLGTLGAQLRDAKRLVSAGLWCETESGYRFNDWDHYQPTKEQVTADREAARERQRKYRERQRNGVSNGVTDGVTNAVSNAAPSLPVLTSTSKASTSSTDVSDFDNFWDAYPKRVDKISARKAYAKAVKSGATPELLAAAAARYAQSTQDPKFTKHPSTWLNAGSYLDAENAPRKKHDPAKNDKAWWASA